MSDLSSTSYTAWQPLDDTLSGFFHEPDLDAVHIIYSAVAAHRLAGTQVWPMVIAPPGSMKTVIVTALAGLGNTHVIDNVTPKTFLSGKIADKPLTRSASPSLLKRIGSSGVIVIPDFSTILSMGWGDQGAVLADLRCIYDGYVRKEFGTDAPLDDREWKGRITCVVAATQEVDNKFKVFQSLGERFVSVRLRRGDPVETALKAMSQAATEAKQELARAVTKLFDDLPAIEPVVPAIYATRIANLATVVARARTHLPRNGYTKVIEVVPEPESSTRLAQQLTQLAKGAALLCRRQAINEQDYLYAVRVAFDCVREPHRGVLLHAIGRDFGSSPTAPKLPPATLSYVREDLKALGVFDSGGFLSSETIEMIYQADPDLVLTCT